MLLLLEADFHSSKPAKADNSSCCMAPLDNAVFQLPLADPVSAAHTSIFLSTISSSQVLPSPHPIQTNGDTNGRHGSDDDFVTTLPGVELDLSKSPDEKILFDVEESLTITIAPNQVKPVDPPSGKQTKTYIWNLFSWLRGFLPWNLVPRDNQLDEIIFLNDFKHNLDNFLQQTGDIESDIHLQNLSSNSLAPHNIPDYVLQHAPLVHLFSDENFWPCDIGKHLHYVTPYLNYTPLKATWEHPLLDDLDKLNNWQSGRHVFLTSNDNVERRPEWLTGRENIPAPPNKEQSSTEGQGPSYKGHAKKQGGKSKAPAVLIVVDKGDGIVDAFWFYFYSYNLGNMVFNVRFGNHVGDWEHSLVRFYNGVPTFVFLSEHSGGKAYTYDAMEKSGKRPVLYSATGTHAMYALPGIHSYILPWGLLHDQTDTGPLWDPALNLYAYTYAVHNDSLYPSQLTPDAPVEWFDFRGHWGDKIYPLSDRRQYSFAGQYHYVSGPLGPRFKNLGRKKVCQGPDEEVCVIRNEIGVMEPRDMFKGWDWAETGLGEDDDVDQA
ncbi:Vacuolar protein sorting-associated protein 62 [Ophidiomyces ophidiicola]|uniref:Vacuolar protein sorting-associated protein 62 n=1 Tax=Ophidiomyces ophidiicola TaxID=1387563 RepID=A0ACB8V291_9EURO|nr:Vacuolar protein sorting-associated protein 62 [Ophidiomyces ophidiicola]KAI1921058.1 Vacuolar protein sorting-associated protein 62 [Ophidiomyces ophidiicola]KAI1944511.1 Vacuolar protein sorting-associated protein 62 [Ophidiomyces ophidiicola]KAI1961822.1 Vacuolar protein sorting-associated protein 62 [Ophidiomyces ophidiicola]KAI1974476.1 Vacuolar protein sorting-associated protein 62 [Ophidiomyces ophidiicola]KAI2008916.1 Vacuolar protein sorting-associated protein 62 [Ophidiomyces ophi